MPRQREDESDLLHAVVLTLVMVFMLASHGLVEAITSQILHVLKTKPGSQQNRSIGKHCYESYEHRTAFHPKAIDSLSC
eukprot:325315-Amphidinium_carterae.1